MKKKFARAGAIFFFLALAFSLPAEEGNKPEDFAGTMIYTGNEGSLLFLEIPLEVYRGLRRHDNGDLRIFDAAGLPVPFIIREKKRELFTPSPEKVPFFLWNGGTDNNFPSGTDIEINTSGGVVRIKNENNSPSPSKTYLADLSRLEYVPSKLKLEMENRAGNFNTAISLFYSDDLSNWKNFPGRQTLASFGPAGEGASGRTVRDTLELPETYEIKNIRYLLIVFGKDAPVPASMTSLFPERERNVEYHEVRIHGEKSPDGRLVSYNTGAYYPAESIDFELPGADSIRSLVKHRVSEREEWTIAREETIFRYNTGEGREKNLPLSLSSRAPFWELEASGDLAFGSVPDLILRFKKKELVFPGRGKGPWTLAYGNADASPIEADIRIPPGALLLEARFSGEKRYDESTGLASPGEEKKGVIFLWIFLGAASLILTALALYIAKSMRK